MINNSKYIKNMAVNLLLKTGWTVRQLSVVWNRDSYLFMFHILNSNTIFVCRTQMQS